MVIKVSAAKRDGERLHPAADVEQERERERGEEMEGEDRVRGGKDWRKRQQRKGKKENWGIEREGER